jgi:glutamate 5-kinase
MVKRRVGGSSNVEVDAVVLANRRDKVAVVEVGSVRGMDSAGPGSPLLLATVPTGLPDMMDDQVALSGRVSPSEPRQETLQTFGDIRYPKNAEAESRETPDDNDGDNDGWEVVEVGRGLANYNSAEITRVMGHKRLVASSDGLYSGSYSKCDLARRLRAYWAMLTQNMLSNISRSECRRERSPV